VKVVILLKRLLLLRMKIEEKYMQQCLKLAKKGFGSVAPNPMVGCVIVHQNKIIGQGYHQKYGEAHAEVNAINSVKDQSLLKESTLYVNLEPCAHFGKTPPCTDLIIQHQIPKVVIGCIDTFSEVSGKGIAKMKAVGIEVVLGVLEKESLTLNKRFFTFHNKKRPYIILKWAETKDGFMDVDRRCEDEGRSHLVNNSIHEIVGHRACRQAGACNEVEKDNWITSLSSKKLVHQWRSEEQAIMVGTKTALNDNPALTVREVEGKNPLRVVLDLNLRLARNLNLFDQSVSTLVFNGLKNETLDNLEFVKIDATKNIIPQILNALYAKDIQSIIIEGGAQLLGTFLQQNMWDEARVFTGNKLFKKGLKAPKILQNYSQKQKIDSDILKIYYKDIGQL